MKMVTLTTTEYRQLKKKADNYDRMLGVTQVYLKGKAAKRLDQEVAEGLREYKSGKTKLFKLA